MALTFTRKLKEDWIFDLTAKDRTGARQSLAGVVDLRARLKDKFNNVVWEDDAAGCTIIEVGASTYGDFTYRRQIAGLTGIEVAEGYRLDFKATIGAIPVIFPEGSYIIVDVI